MTCTPIKLCLLSVTKLNESTSQMNIRYERLLNVNIVYKLILMKSFLRRWKFQKIGYLR